MRLIINADDFGRSSAINRAVVRAHRDGILTSASLMIAGEAADEAVELARQNPDLAVGLHVVAVDGPAVLPPARIPRLVDARGRFPDAPVRLGLRYAFSAAARAEMSAEVTAQFKRFAATGLRLSHVDGHQHMHMHPAVFELVLNLARRFGASRIRVVRDDLWLALRHDPSGALGKILGTAIFALLAWRCREQCRKGVRVSPADPVYSLPRYAGGGLGRGFTQGKPPGPNPLPHPPPVYRGREDGPPQVPRARHEPGPMVPERTYGFLQSGAMDEAYVLRVLRNLKGNSAEVYFHPTDGPRVDTLGPNPGDLATLVSPRVMREVEARGLLLSLNGGTSALERDSERSSQPAVSADVTVVAAP